MGALCYCFCCCFNNHKSKNLEITELVFQSISFVFLFLSLIIIKWSKIPAINITLFILMLLITILIIVFTSFIRYWRAKNLIKTTKKGMGISFASTCFGLIIACFIICIIEEFAISYGFYKADYPCHSSEYSNTNSNSNNYYYKTKLKSNQRNRKLSNDLDCYQLGKEYYAKSITDAEYFISYITFSYLEISFILGVWIWYILRKRIIEGLDGPRTTPPQERMYDQYGRQVVVVQPGDLIYMDGRPNIVLPENQNNYQYNYNYQYNQNLSPSQNISNPINNNQIPNSQEYNLKEKI